MSTVPIPGKVLFGNVLRLIEWKFGEPALGELVGRGEKKKGGAGDKVESIARGSGF